MKARLISKSLPVLILAIVVSGIIWPSPNTAEQVLEPFCREDGYCLPPPREIGEFIRSQEAANAVDPALPEAITCEVALLVKRTEDVSPEAFRSLLERQGYTQIEGLLVPQWWRVCAHDVSAASDEIAAIADLPGVSKAEREETMVAFFTPNDPYYSEQWGLPNVKAPQAWDLTKGLSDVLVSVVDTGFDYSHPDKPIDLWVGWDFINNDANSTDDGGHGTHVMGIAAAAGNNGVGISGVCPNCSALVIKSLDASGSGTTGAVSNGIAYAADSAVSLGKRSVINLSLGGPSYSSLLADAVTYALASGSIVIASAGNEGAGAPSYPAALPGVVAITATDPSDSAAVFSQYGDLAAPGVSILSTWPPYTDPYLSYASWPGTSMASPLVAGAAGLVWSYRSGYTPSQVVQSLLVNADVPPGWNGLYGVGRLNVYSAVSLGIPTATPTATGTATRTPTATTTSTPRASSTLGPARFCYLPLVMRGALEPQPTATGVPVPTQTATRTATATATPTATPPSCNQRVQALVNPGFDGTLAPWQLLGIPLLDCSVPEVGCVVHLAGYNNAQDSIAQSATVPTWAESMAVYFDWIHR
jgi:thermitase